MSSCDGEVKWCYVCSWDMRGDLTLNSMAQIHTSVTLLTSRDLTWRSGRLMCQHASHIPVVAHILWDMTYVSSALQTLSVVCRIDTTQHSGQTPVKEVEIKNILFMSAATLKLVRLECYLPWLPGAKSSCEITWHDDIICCMCATSHDMSSHDVRIVCPWPER